MLVFINCILLICHKHTIRPLMYTVKFDNLSVEQGIIPVPACCWERTVRNGESYFHLRGSSNFTFITVVITSLRLNAKQCERVTWHFVIWNACLLFSSLVFLSSLHQHTQTSNHCFLSPLEMYYFFKSQICRKLY
jgi:hypothetical protein